MNGSIGGADSAWQVGWDQFANGAKCGANAVADATGHVFNVLAAVKDDVSTLSRVLHTASYTIDAVNHDRMLNGGPALSVDRLERNLDKSIAVIDITRVFSVAYYFFSGTFFEDLRNWNFGGAISEVSFAAADCIEAYMGVDEMFKVACDMEATQNDTSELLEKICCGFLIGGYLGQIGKSIHELVTTQAMKPQAWLDLAAAVAGIAIPILLCCNVTIVPLLIALGLLSCTLTVVGAVYRHYTKETGPKGVSPNFADNTLGLGTVLAPISSVATLLEGEPGLEPLAQLSADIGPFKELASGLALFTRLKEWFHPQKGQRFWENASGWSIGSKVCATVQSSMDAASWLGSIGAIEGAFKKNPLFKGFKSLFAIGTSGLSVIDSSIKLHELLPKWEARMFKKHKWEVLTATLTGNDREPAAHPSVEQWNRLQADLVQQYNFKIQKELAANGLRADQGDRYLRALRDALANGETARYFELKAPALRLAEDARVRGLLTQDAARREQLGDVGLSLNERQALEAQLIPDDQRALLARDLLSNKKRVKLEAQSAALGACDVVQFVDHKKASSEWKFRELDINKTNTTWQIVSDAFKVALAIANLAAIFFASLLGVFPTCLALFSSFANGGKYFADACYKITPKPLLVAAADTAAAAA